MEFASLVWERYNENYALDQEWTDCPSCGQEKAIDPSGVEPECLECTYLIIRCSSEDCDNEVHGFTGLCGECWEDRYGYLPDC